MFKSKKLRTYFPILSLVFLLYMCAGTGGDYSDWYADDAGDDPFGDFGFDDGWGEEPAPEQPAAEEPLDPVFDQGDDQEIEPDQEADAPVNENRAVPPQNDEPVMGHIAEFRSEIVREAKMPSQNKIELTVANKVRVKTIPDSRWRAFNGARVSVDDNQNLMITYKSTETNANGLFHVILEPADPYKFFSFVPFKDTGFLPYDYAMPVDALDLHTLTFNLQTDEGAWHTYQYTYQTYDLRQAIDYFVNMEVNRKSKPVTIQVYGKESRYPIRNAKVTITGTPPSRLRLLNKYFRDMDMLNYALSVAPDYAGASTTIYSNMAGAKFNLSYPHAYTIEISHPDYFYVSKKLNVTEKTDAVDVYLDRMFATAKIVQRSTVD